MTDAEQDLAAPSPCSACRGTGRVVSNLGGAPAEKPCPWCDGTGTFIPGHDAQAHWAGDAEPTAPHPQTAS